MNYLKKKIEKYRFFLFLISFLYYFFPLVSSGLIGDDAYNSQTNGRLIDEDLNIFEFYYREAFSWYWNNGRLFPISIGMYFLFHIIENVVLIKTYYLTLILLNLIIFYNIILNFTYSKKFSFFIIIFIFTSVQFRLWHDPILSFHGLLQTLTLFFFLSIYFFQKYYLHKKLIYINLSAFFYFLSLLTYEVSYLFILFLFLMIYFNEGNFLKSINILKKHFILFFIVLILVAIAKVKISITGENFYPSYEQNFNYINFIKSFLIQITSSFNLTYTLGHAYKFGTSFIYSNSNYFDLVFISILYILFSQNLEKNTINNQKLLTILSLYMIIFISILVSISGHQDEIANIGPGIGYLPIYIQYFFSCIILFFLAQKIAKFNSIFKKLLYFSIPIVLTLSTYLHLLTNREVVKIINKDWKEPRAFFKQILLSEEISFLNNGDLIIREMNSPHDWMWFYTQYTKKKFIYCDLKNKKYEYCYPHHKFLDFQKKPRKIYLLTKDIENKKYIFYDIENINLNERIFHNLTINKKYIFEEKNKKLLVETVNKKEKINIMYLVNQN